jgi:hypothetical protein
LQDLRFTFFIFEIESLGSHCNGILWLEEIVIHLQSSSICAMKYEDVDVMSCIEYSSASQNILPSVKNVD